MTDDQTRRPQTTVRELIDQLRSVLDSGDWSMSDDTWHQLDCIAQDAADALSLLDAREAQPPTGWQPIATAPEATTVFVWLPNYGAFPAHMTRDANGNPDWWNRGDNEPCYPTHWRPMFEKPGESPAQPPTGTPAEPRLMQTMGGEWVWAVEVQEPTADAQQKARTPEPTERPR